MSVSTTEVRISRSTLLNNFASLKRTLDPELKIALVVKGNAYGHDLKTVVSVFENYVDYFQIDDVDELHRLRGFTQKTALILGYIRSEQFQDVFKNNAIPALFSEEQIHHAENAVKSLQPDNNKPYQEVFIAIDSYFGREGLLLSDLSHFLKTFKKTVTLKLSGIYSHFSSIYNDSDFSITNKQLEIFESAISCCNEFGFHDLKNHICASSGCIFVDPKMLHTQVVRVGTLPYGMWNNETAKNFAAKKNIFIQPALTWVTYIAQVKTLPPGHPIGYLQGYVTEKKTTLAILPIGYSDGFPYQLGNNGYVLIKGKRCSVLGRVSMNMIAVDVSDIHDVQSDEEVILIGKSGDQVITADEIAERVKSTNLEITCRIPMSIKRILVE
jgi:alanine racemase